MKKYKIFTSGKGYESGKMKKQPQRTTVLTREKVISILCGQSCGVRHQN